MTCWLKDGSTLSDAVVAAAETHYGYAGRAFLEKLTRDERDWQAHYDAFKATSEFTVGGADGQVKRAASKFALLAMAGELAIEQQHMEAIPKRGSFADAAETIDGLPRALHPPRSQYPFGSQRLFVC
jgi:hypothetical protein